MPVEDSDSLPKREAAGSVALERSGAILDERTGTTG